MLQDVQVAAFIAFVDSPQHFLWTDFLNVQSLFPDRYLLFFGKIIRRDGHFGLQ